MVHTATCDCGYQIEADSLEEAKKRARAHLKACIDATQLFIENAEEESKCYKIGLVPA